MGITVVNWQTRVELTELDKLSWLYHPRIGAKLSGMATSQHAVTANKECLCATVLLYLKTRTINVGFINYLFGLMRVSQND